MLRFTIISKPLFLNIFWKILFFFFFYCQPLVFLKTANSSSLYSPMLLGLYLLPIKLNIKKLISSHTSASSYDLIVTSNLLLLLIHGSPSLYKRDLLAWKIVSLSLDFIVTCWSRSLLCQTLAICVNYYVNVSWYECIDMIGTIILYIYT